MIAPKYDLLRSNNIFLMPVDPRGPSPKISKKNGLDVKK